MSPGGQRELEHLFCQWTGLRDERIASGRLRPSSEEGEAFTAYVERLESLGDADRAEWDQKRNDIECRPSLPRCDCGHPEALHVEGSCYALVGCSTTCDCAK